jgi:hypothetical protein
MSSVFDDDLVLLSLRLVLQHIGQQTLYRLLQHCLVAIRLEEKKNLTEDSEVPKLTQKTPLPKVSDRQ